MMRALAIVVCLFAAGPALADKVAPLPKPADHPPSTQAKDESWSLYIGCTIEQNTCLASWRRAAVIDPSNIEVRTALADYYYRGGDQPTALAIMGQLKDAACQECLQALIGSAHRTWSQDAVFDAKVTNGIHGRRTRYSKVARIVIAALTTGDWAKLKPFVPANGNVGLPPSSEGDGSVSAIRRWLADVSKARVEVRASGLTTCEDDCCYEMWDTLGGDTPSYLMGMCFAPGPVLRQTLWDDLR